MAEFVAAARAAGATLPFFAAVAVYTDERSARVLQRFPGLHLDAAVVERVLGRAGSVTPPASRSRSPRPGHCSPSPAWSA